MKTLRTQNFRYDGLGIVRTNLEVPFEVEILGVMSPPDPGFVRIRENGKEYDVPAFVLKPTPAINWEKMLTKEQREQREACGMLFGNGGYEQTLIPIEKCPLLKGRRHRRGIR